MIEGVDFSKIFASFGQEPVIDTLTPSQRSKRMALVSGKDTAPEVFVRRIVHSMGYRYRLHVRALPGTPDIVFPRTKKVIFVHGCFWHRHTGCGRLPKSRKRFWITKLEQNRQRDISNLRKLRRRGWQVLVLWECKLGKHGLGDKIREFLEDRNAYIR
jgi:DNA mismatch endonuclease (patch repair protein)